MLQLRRQDGVATGRGAFRGEHLAIGLIVRVARGRQNVLGGQAAEADSRDEGDPSGKVRPGLLVVSRRPANFGRKRKKRLGTDFIGQLRDATAVGEQLGRLRGGSRNVGLNGRGHGFSIHDTHTHNTRPLVNRLTGKG